MPIIAPTENINLPEGKLESENKCGANAVPKATMYKNNGSKNLTHLFNPFFTKYSQNIMNNPIIIIKKTYLGNK